MRMQNLVSRFGIAAAIFVFVTTLAMLGVFERYEYILYDSWFNLRGKISPGEKIVIVGIDDHTYSTMGLSIPRSAHGKLLEQLREAQLVGFDVQFETKGKPEEDEAFAGAIKKHGRVVLACGFNYGKDQEGKVDAGITMPNQAFLKYCRSIGYINMNTDMDNTVRRLMPALEYNRFAVPSFSLSIALLSMGKDPNKLVFKDGNLTLKDGGFSIPLDRQKPYHLMNFWGPQGAFKLYSYADVLEGKYSPETFRDKIVLIGPTSPYSHDDFNIPFTRSNMVLKNNLPTFGVEIHASAIQTFLEGSHFTRAQWPVNLLIMILSAAIAYLAIYKRGPWVGLGGFLSTAASVCVVAFLAWLYQRYWINLASPLILIVFSYIGITTDNFVREAIEKKRTRTIFGRYVSPHVVSQLLEKPEMMGLGGKRENLTLLFSDIRGFTSYSDGRAPEEVVAKLNEYLTVMTNVIFKNGGTLDKYMGDGIMAFFGAPVFYPDHAERAVKTGLEMLEGLEDLNKLWQEKGEVTLRMGVGISTGNVVVGNVGSPERMDYTVIGEDVNLASRLESMNKEFKTQIIISGSTYQQLDISQPGRTFTHLGSVPVRGFELPVEVYTAKKIPNTEGLSGRNPESRSQESE